VGTVIRLSSGLNTYREQTAKLLSFRAVREREGSRSGVILRLKTLWEQAKMRALKDEKLECK